MVGDVTDDAAGAWRATRRASLTCLDVDHLGRFLEPVVLEGDIPDATVVITRDDGADSHSTAVLHSAITDHDVLSALSELSSLRASLYRDSIVKVRDFQTLDDDVGAADIYSIGAEGESW